MCKGIKSIIFRIFRHRQIRNSKASFYYSNEKAYTRYAARFFPRASLTVEAAFVVPIGVLLFVLILSLFLLLQLQVDVEKSLHYAARKTAATVSVEKEGGLVNMAEAQLLFWASMQELDPPTQFVTGGKMGLSLLFSETDDQYIELRAVYHVKLPIYLFGKQSFLITQHERARLWNGYVASDHSDKNSESENERVYITPTGHAYHKSTSCSSLDLSIRSVSASQVGDLRNGSGGKYYPCSCCKGNQNAASFYITSWGEEYHASLTCSDLKRTIQHVEHSEVGSRTPCKICYGDSD